MKLDSTLKLAVYVLRVIVCIAVLGVILLIWLADMACRRSDGSLYMVEMVQS
jgi:hypothetical protein